jgi:hypothetical protein
MLDHCLGLFSLGGHCHKYLFSQSLVYSPVCLSDWKVDLAQLKIDSSILPSLFRPTEGATHMW